MTNSPKHIHILRHSLGLDEKGHGREYRNYYCTGKDCDGFADIATLAAIGLMAFGRKDGDNLFYFVTEAGKELARKDVVYPKLTRSQKRFRAFKNADSGLTFGEWLRTKWGKMSYE